MLYLIATPIGNLEDISQRALSTLSSCDYILCEDTRRTQQLCHHFSISAQLKSFHKFNETSLASSIIEDLKQGKNIGLVSDAGTPGICDPGEDLIALCWEHNIDVEHIPGPCSIIHALVVSGIVCTPFQFLGFLPKETQDCLLLLRKALYSPLTTICFETPHRIIKTLEYICSVDETRLLFIGRELTKKFETAYRESARDMVEIFKKTPPKGEFVLIISPQKSIEDNSWDSLSIPDQVREVEEKFHYSKNESIKFVADLRGLSKRDVYQIMISQQN